MSYGVDRRSCKGCSASSLNPKPYTNPNSMQTQRPPGLFLGVWGDSFTYFWGPGKPYNLDPKPRNLNAERQARNPEPWDASWNGEARGWTSVKRVCWDYEGNMREG